MPQVLHVGCGRRALPAYFQDGAWTEIRLDIDPSVAPDVVSTMVDMGAIDTGSVQAVFSSHNIEHLYQHEVPLALAEFRRVLSGDGFAIITCPDLQSVAELIVADRLLEKIFDSKMGPIRPLDIVYGHGPSVAAGNHHMAHRGGFTLSTLSQALMRAGFARIAGSRRPSAFDLWVLGTVAALSDDALRQKAAPLFNWLEPGQC